MEQSRIVIYQSRYGTVEKYAEWISAALECPMKKLQDISSQELADYGTIIYGGGIYAGKVSGLKKFLAKLGRTKHQKVVLFMAGMTDTADEEFYQGVAKENIPADWREDIKVFFLRGDQLYSRMNRLHKFIMRIPKAAVEKKPVEQRTEDDIYVIEHFGSDIIFADKEQIGPIIDYFKDA